VVLALLLPEESKLVDFIFAHGALRKPYIAIVLPALCILVFFEALARGMKARDAVATLKAELDDFVRDTKDAWAGE
jgi:hypothetical protein